MGEVWLDVELVDKDDTLTLHSETVEGIAAIWPEAAESPYLARFFKEGQVAKVFEQPSEVEEEWKRQEAQDASAEVVRRVTADEVIAAAPRRGDPSRSENITDPNRPAGPGQRMLVKRKTGEEPPEDLTHGQALAILKGGEDA